jgi:hypothetical protein
LAVLEQDITNRPMSAADHHKDRVKLMTSTAHPMPLANPSDDFAEPHWGDLRKRAFLKRWLAYRARPNYPARHGPESAAVGSDAK